MLADDLFNLLCAYHRGYEGLDFLIYPEFCELSPEAKEAFYDLGTLMFQDDMEEEDFDHMYLVAHL